MIYNKSAKKFILLKKYRLCVTYIKMFKDFLILLSSVSCVIYTIWNISKFSRITTKLHRHFKRFIYQDQRNVFVMSLCSYSAFLIISDKVKKEDNNKERKTKNARKKMWKYINNSTQKNAHYTDICFKLMIKTCLKSQAEKNATTRYSRVNNPNKKLKMILSFHTRSSLSHELIAEVCRKI